MRGWKGGGRLRWVRLATSQFFLLVVPGDVWEPLLGHRRVPVGGEGRCWLGLHRLPRQLIQGKFSGDHAKLLEVDTFPFNSHRILHTDSQHRRIMGNTKLNTNARYLLMHIYAQMCAACKNDQRYNNLQAEVTCSRTSIFFSRITFTPVLVAANLTEEELFITSSILIINK